MGEIHIGRLRRDRGISVARPTALGNPFPVGEPYTRSESIARFRVWFADQLARRDRRVRAQLARILRAARAGDVTLLCWCAPLPCHAEVIADWIEAHRR